MTPRVLVVEHEAICPPARMGTWLAEAGVEVVLCRPWAGDELPTADGWAYDGLLVLGGTMSADDDAAHRWLGPLKELVRGLVAAQVPTLGICLGHQVITLALGGEVRPNPAGQQLGPLPVGWTDAAAGDPLVGAVRAAAGAAATGGASTVRGVHWNNDVATRLPDGTTVLATAPGGEVQVARFGPAAWGVQLHPEVDEHVVSAWADGDREAHGRRGVDGDAVVRAVADADAELVVTWRPLAVALAGLAADHSRGSRAGQPGERSAS